MNIEDVLKSHGFGGSGSNIKSIQYGTKSINSSGQTQAINAVDLTKSIVLISYSPTAITNGYVRDLSVAANLNSSTSIQFLLSGSGTTMQINWIVVEFNNVKSFQKGTVSISSSGNTTQIINSIDLSKSELFMSNASSSTSQLAADYLTSGTITNSTTLTFSQMNPIAKTIYWQVIEFN